MGMAASQARLLCITARIHDVEQQAQAIQNAKIQLATQSDKAYREYNEALDAQSLTLMTCDNNGNKTQVVANFRNLASFNALSTCDDKEYIITHKNKGLVVDSFIKAGYDRFMSEVQGGSAEDFAMFMVSGGKINNFADLHGSMRKAKENVYHDNEANSTLKDIHDEIITLFNEKNPDWQDLIDDPDVDKDSVYNDEYVGLGPEETAKYNELLAAFENELYKNYGKEIYDKLREEETALPEVDFDNAEFRKYMNIFNLIKSCGGCTSIDDYNGANGKAATDSEFLQNMIEAGLFRVGIVEYDDTTGKAKYSATSPSSDISLSYVNTSEVDNTALKKAEAEYNRALEKINKKDKQFDLDLSKLETERSALTTEYESVNKVISENIERTFGIFS